MAIRIRKRIDSETLHLPELRHLIGKVVDITVEEEQPATAATAAPRPPIEPGDAWVAATALRHSLPLVTHNRRHFEHIPGIQSISEAP